MQFIKLETLEQLFNLKKGDLVIAEWRDPTSVIAYKIHGLILNNTEVLLDKKMNKYFIIDLYLKGESFVKEAYLVLEGD